jgi:hypothetical protein
MVEQQVPAAFAARPVLHGYAPAQPVVAIPDGSVPATAALASAQPAPVINLHQTFAVPAQPTSAVTSPFGEAVQPPTHMHVDHQRVEQVFEQPAHVISTAALQAGQQPAPPTPRPAAAFAPKPAATLTPKPAAALTPKPAAASSSAASIFGNPPGAPAAPRTAPLPAPTTPLGAVPRLSTGGLAAPSTIFQSKPLFGDRQQAAE